MKNKIPKTLLLFILIFLIFSLAGFLFFKPFLVWLFKIKLGHIFIDSKVSVGSLYLSPRSGFILSSIKVRRLPFYSLEVGKITVDYDVSSILKGNLKSVFLKDIKLYLKMKSSENFNLHKYIRIRSGSGILVQKLKLDGLRLDIRKGNIPYRSKLSLDLVFSKQRPDFFSLWLDYLDAPGLELKNTSLQIAFDKKGGSFFIPLMQAGRLSFKDMQGRLDWQDDDLFIRVDQATLFNGDIKLDFRINLSSPVSYSGDIFVSRLDLISLVSDLKLKDKLSLSGLLNGKVHFAGQAARLSRLEGLLLADERGGRFSLEDKNITKNLALSGNLPLDIFVESLKNYHYNKGSVRLDLKNQDLLFTIELLGETGKRNLEVVVHDIESIFSLWNLFFKKLP